MERVIDRTPTVTDEGCILWPGFIHRTGYGQVKVEGRVRGAHVVAYEREVGPVPDGMELDHICHDPNYCSGGWSCLHRRCVNTKHLEPVTASENQRRARDVAWCRNGLHMRFGEGECRECQRERKRKYKRKMRQAGLRHISG
jgi:hypothetical protein